MGHLLAGSGQVRSQVATRRGKQQITITLPLAVDSHLSGATTEGLLSPTQAWTLREW